jgi:hypothetical protein
MRVAGAGWARGKASRPETLWIAAVGLAALTIALAWPGSLIGDSIKQLRQIRSGHITDWHPPLMTLIWRALGATPQSLLILQAVIYWSGMGLLAARLRSEAGPKWGYAMLLIGLTPISVIYLGVIQKDTLLAALFVLSAGISAWFGRAPAAAAAFLGMLTRANAIFAFPPMIVSTRRLLPALLLCLALSAALVPISRFINHSVLGAEASHVEKSLQLFDIAGIQYHLGREDYVRGISGCYSPFYWDTLELDCHAFTRSPDDLTGTWLKAIAQHPLAYAEHRIVHFDHNIFFLVPQRQECVYVPQHHDCGGGSRALIKDALVRNAFLWPVTWLLVGTLMLFVPLAPLARALSLSGLLYGLAYLIVGVASGFRYFYWTELAIQLALAWQLAVGRLPNWRTILWAVVALWLVGYVYRYAPMLLASTG